MAARVMALTADESALVEEFLHGDRERAASQFVRRYQRFVYGIALRYLDGDRDDADDVAQETFIRAFRALHRFKGDGSLKTWLYRITVNTCISFRRKWKKFVRLEDVLESVEDVRSSLPTPDRDLEDADFLERFQAMLSKLPPKQRETFYLRYVEGLSYEEISAILGISVSGLKANYHHAVRKLAEMLGRPIPKGDKR